MRANARLGADSISIQRAASPVFLLEVGCCSPSALPKNPSPLIPQLSNTDFRSALTFREVSSESKLARQRYPSETLRQSGLRRSVGRPEADDGRACHRR